MARFEHVRHKPPRPLLRPRELVLACAPMRSNVNLSSIVRLAGCCGIESVVCTGGGRVIEKVARDGAEQVRLVERRTLAPALRELRAEGRTLVGLEQTTGSTSLFEHRFERRTVLVIGNERQGLEDDVLEMLDAVVEIPVWGLPYSFNVATATAMALYEYCRQHPDG
jgi:tRNA G18 (ribose-2'-O)-methylase SpoU